MLRSCLITLVFLFALAGCTNRPTPTPTRAPTPTPIPATATPAPANLLETAARTGELTTFLAAVQAADLTEKLESPGPFTIFAPTDAAFGALPAGLLDKLLSDPGGDLTDLLIFHLAAGQFTSDQLADGQQLTSVLDDPLTITRVGEALQVNGATMLVADIGATNGVIHVIDKVLLPPGMEE